MPADNQANLTIVGPPDRFPQVTLVPPTTSGYLLLGLEIDDRPPFAYAWESAQKKRTIAAIKRTIASLDAPDLVEAVVFKALVIPPGRGSYLNQRTDVTIARFDVVLLLEFQSPAAAASYRDSAQWQQWEAQLSEPARRSLTVSASNTRRIGAVDHTRDGVFLFNFFVADSLEQNLGVWEYTAGWFQDQTGLDNSTLFVPDASEKIDYTVINHCRWNKMSDIAPSLLFKPSFRKFVLANFLANQTAAIPILYKLA